jgi:hypothetical protein
LFGIRDSRVDGGKVFRVCDAGVNGGGIAPVAGGIAPSGGGSALIGGGIVPSGGGSAPGGGGIVPSGGGSAPIGGGIVPSGGGSAPIGGGIVPSGGGSAPIGGGTECAIFAIPATSPIPLDAGWTIENPRFALSAATAPPTTNALFAIWGTIPNDYFVAGSGATLLHWKSDAGWLDESWRVPPPQGNESERVVLEGLSSNGLTWIAADGLWVSDGGSFSEHVVAGFPNNPIVTNLLASDRDGGIWVASNTGSKVAHLASNGSTTAYSDVSNNDCQNISLYTSGSECLVSFVCHSGSLGKWVRKCESNINSGARILIPETDGGSRDPGNLRRFFNENDGGLFIGTSGGGDFQREADAGWTFKLSGLNTSREIFDGLMCGGNRYLVGDPALIARNNSEIVQNASSVGSRILRVAAGSNCEMRAVGTSGMLATFGATGNAQLAFPSGRNRLNAAETTSDTMLIVGTAGTIFKRASSAWTSVSAGSNQLWAAASLSNGTRAHIVDFPNGNSARIRTGSLGATPTFSTIADAGEVTYHYPVPTVRDSNNTIMFSTNILVSIHADGGTQTTIPPNDLDSLAMRQCGGKTAIFQRDLTGSGNAAKQSFLLQDGGWEVLAAPDVKNPFNQFDGFEVTGAYASYGPALNPWFVTKANEVCELVNSLAANCLNFGSSVRWHHIEVDPLGRPWASTQTGVLFYFDGTLWRRVRTPIGPEPTANINISVAFFDGGTFVYGPNETILRLNQ